MPKKNKKQKTKILIPVIAGVLVVAMVAALIFLKSQKLTNKETVTLYLPSGSTYQSVVDSLNAHDCIGNRAAFETMAKLRKYPKHVKGGCYKIEPQMNVWRALTKLYYGNQDAVRITINKYRTKDELCKYLDKKLEMSADMMIKALNNDSLCGLYGHTPETIIGMFVQNTYDIYWNTTPEKLLERMDTESKKFWGGKREERLKKLKMNENEVLTIASIVEEETNKNDEKANIASVYLNRLRKGMLLQADPTLKYALGDFTLRRILNKHMEVESPYNTYKYKGLPPGPICIPGPASIDAVLENKQTDYLYFCAKADFSGYHAFATSLAQHNANANAFHAEMNKRKIYK